MSEFGFRAMDSGLPNTKGAGPLVPTQTDRAAGFSGYVQGLAALPYVVGYHMFMYYDEPSGGAGLAKLGCCARAPWRLLLPCLAQCVFFTYTTGGVCDYSPA